jgi:Fur family transcriptional regulator, peroxide stress response regulator
MTTDLKEALRSRGIPLTHQRLAIYERLKEAKDHPSAEQLYAALKPKYPSLSLATVYKTLQTLAKLKLIQIVDTPHSQARYDAITERHHHFVCERCGEIKDLFDERLDDLPAPKGVGAIFGHSVHFRGLCATCAGRNHRRKK